MGLNQKTVFIGSMNEISTMCFFWVTLRDEFVWPTIHSNFTVVVFCFVSEIIIQESVAVCFSGDQNQLGILIINWCIHLHLD
jgi:hypothetical protein